MAPPPAPQEAGYPHRTRRPPLSPQIAALIERLATGNHGWGYQPFLDHSPAVHVRRPRLDYESYATGLDRNELGAMLVAAGRGWRLSTR